MVFSSPSSQLIGLVSTASSSKLVVAPLTFGFFGPSPAPISMVEMIPLKITPLIQPATVVQKHRYEIAPVAMVHEQSILMDTQAYHEEKGLLGTEPPASLPVCSPLVNSSAKPSLKEPVRFVPNSDLPQYSSQSWAKRLKHSTDRCLCRLAPAPTTVSPMGKPRIKIPDEVFKRGADMRKGYIGDYFLGKPPSYHLI